MQTNLQRLFTSMIVTSVVAGVVLSILAPFGTGNFSFIGRLTYWVGLCLAGGIGAWGAEFIISKITGRSWLLSGKPWPTAIWQSLGATLMVTLFAIPLHRPHGWLDIALSLFYIWVVAMVICTVGALQKKGEAAVAAPDTRPALYERLKPTLRQADIYALSSEDHYVRIITSEGDDLVLMRLSDAIKEVAPLPGLSPHRSWWVAEGGTKTVKRIDGKTVITLANDISIPVSRNGAKALREAGWL
ncbi:LytTR family DNA-binding domain-containing protein [Fretibacter rubidus]|uniref:LytTR family DNA-binding domain-containing protein n=1 Tax=Fretibacter rubidus TaxID=570162 RepID=UPI00352B8F20